jgi:hypothetical protein
MKLFSIKKFVAGKRDKTKSTSYGKIAELSLSRFVVNLFHLDNHADVYKR